MRYPVPLLACLALSQAVPAAATSVVAMDLSTLADYAAQVIDGRVDSVESSRTPGAVGVVSLVTFKEVGFLKGAPDKPPVRFTLQVPGGRVDDVEMRIAGAPRFQEGQRWILFLLPTYKTHPVVGIYQGAFRLVDDTEGTTRVFDASGNPITGIDQRGFLQHEPPPQLPPDRVEESTTVRIVRDEDPASEALSLPDFQRLLTPTLEASRDHGLTEPAARPVEPDYRSVHLRRSNAENGGRYSCTLATR